jgi:RNA polymerase sigma-70 factor (ECF subfamily)
MVNGSRSSRATPDDSEQQNYPHGGFMSLFGRVSVKSLFRRHFLCLGQAPARTAVRSLVRAVQKNRKVALSVIPDRDGALPRKCDRVMEPFRSDRSLMHRFRDGDQRAASALYARYVKRLRGLAQVHDVDVLAPRVDADDIVQSAFGSFFRGAREGLYHAPPSGELWQLLAAITRHKLNRARVHHTAEKRDARITSGGEVSAELAAHGGQPLAEVKLVIEEILETRVPVERTIVQLRIEGRAVAEIAGNVGRSKRTVERVLQEFRDDLCTCLEQDP